MSSVCFVTYANQKFEAAKQRIGREALAMGVFTRTVLCGPENVAKEVREKMMPYIDMPRGGGYWLWKPVIVKSVLDTLKENDILVYCDAGCTLNAGGVKRMKEYIEMVKSPAKPVVRFQMNWHHEKCWTNEPVFQHFKIPADSPHRQTGQYMATAFVLRKCAISCKIIDQWYSTAVKHPALFSDALTAQNRTLHLKDHRHDQSVFSIIAKLNAANIHTLVDESIHTQAGKPIWATRKRG